MKKRMKKLMGLIALMSIMLHGQVFAQTNAGESIENTATVNFEVGGVAQTPVSSNTSDFVVDRNVNFTLVLDDATYVSTTPGSATSFLTYTLTNLSNGPLDFNLAALQQAGGTDAFGGTDNQDADALTIFVDSNGNGTYDLGVDTVAFADELPGAGVVGNNVKVFVVVDTPTAAVNGEIIGVNLQATAATPGTVGTQGAALTSSATDGEDVVDTLFTDGTGTGGDAAADGIVSALNAAQVVAANLTVVKTSAVISDPIRGTSNPLRIPGAVVEWTITITNAGATSATNLVVSDALDTDTTYVVNSIVVGGTAEDDNAAGADETDPNGADFGATTAGAVTANIGTVAGSGASTTVVFRVTID